MTAATVPFQWTGHVLSTNRAQVFEALKEPETMSPGIYLLVGVKDGNDTIYVGETDEIRTRIKQHLQEGTKDWWERAIFVSAQGGEPLNKAHARYLEHRIFETAKSIKKVSLDNNKAPTASPLSKAAVAHMEDFLSNLRLVLPALRFDFLSNQSRQDNSEDSGNITEDKTYFVLTTKHVKARAHQNADAFVVEQGSEVRETWVGTTTKNSGYGRLYSELVKQGVIGWQGTRFVFLESYGFSSSSAAASVVTGRPASGTASWYLESDESQSFGEFEKAKAALEPLP
ncbi:GIY-YIG nuclease family protein [uncultured Tateyamaria sp.]|uniref:GIY-YIG nuclease family protein n=1 Tax=uncultured Tateyamaria sp. TaxID=455651 RepID=UPI0026041CE1|nr:GIY-YIG nuclease family protein [uncultured Tateyamaria sp.]